MSEFDNWLGDNLPKPDPKNPESWMTGQSSLTDIDIFLTNVISLNIEEFETTTENILFNALHDAAFGITSSLAMLITEERYLHQLTDNQRRTIAWVLCNKPKLKYKLRNTSAIKSNLIRKAAKLHGWCGYQKSMAIDLAAMEFLTSPTGKYAQLIYKNVPQEYWGVISKDSLTAHKDGLADCSDFNRKLKSKAQTIWSALKSETFEGLFEDIVKKDKKRIEEMNKERDRKNTN